MVAKKRKYNYSNVAKKFKASHGTFHDSRPFVRQSYKLPRRRRKLLAQPLYGYQQKLNPYANVRIQNHFKNIVLDTPVTVNIDNRDVPIMVGVSSIGRAVVIHTSQSTETLLNISLAGTFWSSVANMYLREQDVQGVNMKMSVAFNWCLTIVDSGASLVRELEQFRAPQASPLEAETLDVSGTVLAVQEANILTPSSQNIVAYGSGMIGWQYNVSAIAQKEMRVSVKSIKMEPGDRLVLLVKPMSTNAFLAQNPQAGSLNYLVSEAASRVSGIMSVAYSTTTSY